MVAWLVERRRLLEFFIYVRLWRHAPRMVELMEAAAWWLWRRSLVGREISAGGAPLGVYHGWDRLYAPWLAQFYGVACGPPSRRRRNTSLALRRHTDEASLLITEIPAWQSHEFARDGWLILPKRVAHVQPLVGVSGDPNPFESKVCRQLRASDLRVRLSESRRDLESFFAQIYLPMVRKRHGRFASPAALGVLTQGLARGVLILVERQEGILAGALVVRSFIDPREAQIWLLGVAAESSMPDLAKLAPIAAAVTWARESGYERCNHMGSPPFLLDGLMQRKLHWGTTLTDMPERRDRLAVFFNRDGGALRQLLARTPMVVIGERGLVGLSGAPSTTPFRWPSGLSARYVAPDSALPGDEVLVGEDRAAALATLARQLWRC